MKRIARVLGVLLLLLLGVAGGSFAWASSASAARMSTSYETHVATFPVPFPLSEAERAEIGDGDAAAIALERAQQRGEHLIEAIYACTECHGKDLGGGTMVDDPGLGRFFGKNLTAGKGGVVGDYTSADWDRIVRHGVLPTGKPTVMPSLDFAQMSDRELSDIVAAIRSRPPVDREMPAARLGPVGKVLVATNQLQLSAERTELHHRPHAVEPPASAETVDFGKHLASVCVGCHGPELAGGPIIGGDPGWPVASNLTPHADGLAGWSAEDFSKALVHGETKDGHTLRPPMSGLAPFAAKMTATELAALWAYVRSLPPKASPDGTANTARRAR